MFSFCFCLVISQSYSQVNYTTSFTGCSSSTCSGWTISGGTSPGITSTAGSGFTPCNTASAKSDIWSSSTTTTLKSDNSLGTSNGQTTTLTFSGKAIDYSTGAATTAGYCTFTASWSTNGSTWNTINSLTNIASSSCNTYTFNTFIPTAGQPLYIKIVAVRSNGDFWAVMDDISVVQAACGPTGTMTKTCDPTFTSYSVSVQIDNLNGATGANINDGTTTYQSNVGIGTYIITGLSGSKTIYVEDVSNSSCNFNQAFTNCNICTDAPSLPTNECASAPLIDLTQSFAGSTSCSYTASAGSPSGCGTIENDSWMTFIAASSNVEIEFQVGTCSSGFGIQLVVFSGSCGSLTQLAGSCVNPASDGYNSGTTATWNFSGLTIGNTYYIRIDGYAGDLCDYWFTPISGVVITPANDLCADAMTLTCGGSDIASNILATGTDAPTACSGGGTTSKGVWYTFTGTGQEVTISTDNAGTNFDTDINIFSGSCGSLTCVGGDTDSGTGTTSSYTFTTTNAVIYYIYVDGNGAAEGQFEISLTCTGCNANAGSWN